jgi:hypothetical protein
VGTFNGYTCLECVKYYDDWCTGSPVSGDNWDDTCSAQCSDKCAEYCGGGASLAEAKDLFAGWDPKDHPLGEVTPVRSTPTP